MSTAFTLGCFFWFRRILNLNADLIWLLTALLQNPCFLQLQLFVEPQSSQVRKIALTEEQYGKKKVIQQNFSLISSPIQFAMQPDKQLCWHNRAHGTGTGMSKPRQRGGELPILALLLTKHTECWLWLTGSSTEMLITHLLALPHGCHMDHLQLLQSTCPKAGHRISSPVLMHILKCYRKYKRRV